MNKTVKRDRRMLGLPACSVLPLCLSFTWNAIIYWGARQLAGGKPHYSMETWLDARIPLMPAALFVYFGCYLFWGVNYVLIARQEKAAMYRFFAADFISRIVCFLFFVLLPTTNMRPEIAGSGWLADGMRFLYRVDAADNLFPSIHCLVSWFCYLGIRRDTRIPGWYKGCSALLAVLVFASTLLTKQHVLADVVGGVVLAELCMYLSGHSRLPEWYEAMVSGSWRRRRRKKEVA